jgi:hypothetical protein
LSSFGGDRTVIVKINPADVVSIPSDYNDAKGRACRYEVVGEVGVNPDDEVEFTQPVQSNANGNTYVAPKASGPKSGSSEFYRGYDAGYTDCSYDGRTLDYSEGYTKGETDRQDGVAARYIYANPRSQNTWSISWPQNPATP